MIANLRRLSALRVLLASGLLVAAFTAAATPAEPPARVGRIGEFQGNVWVFDTEQGQWIEGQRNRALTEGDRVSTEGAARAEVRIGSTELRLAGATEVEFARMDDERMVLQLHRGSLALRIRSGEIARELEVATTEAHWQPGRAGHYRFDREDEVSAGSVWRGSLQARTRVNSLEVAPGQRLEVTLQSPDGSPAVTWSATVADAFADWVARDEQRDDRSASLRYVSPEMTGVEDLDRHGRWERHPDYGAVWTPFAVAPDWAPYRYGRWYWHARWGWTWIDDAPWGFAPFHYGRWMSWNGRWAWWPGAYVPRPVFAPALVAWVGGPTVGFSASIGAGPVVGWLPLAPYDVYLPGFAYGPRYYDRVNQPHRPPPRFQRQVPTGPIMYGNKGVPGAVTVVPSNVLQQRQPVQRGMVDEAAARRVVGERGFGGEAPVQATRPAARPPTSQVVPVKPVPGGGQPATIGTNRPPQAAGTQAPQAPQAPQVIDLRRERPGVPGTASAPGTPGVAPSQTLTTVSPGAGSARPTPMPAPPPTQATQRMPQAAPQAAPPTPATTPRPPPRPETPPPAVGRLPATPAPQAPQAPQAFAPAGPPAAAAAPPPHERSRDARPETKPAAKPETPARTTEPRSGPREQQGFN